MNVTVLLNARSGTAAEADVVVDAFDRFGVRCEIVVLEDSPGASEQALEAARRSDVLVAAGGDGTINATATAIVESGGRAALGLMPMGTCNDLSRSLHEPADIYESADVIVRGRSVPFDVVLLDGKRIMVNQANGGFSGTVARELEDEDKSTWGPLGYWKAGIGVIQDMDEYDVTAVIDGERLRLRALNLTVANARFSGGGVPVAPSADYADGLMDVVIVRGGPWLTKVPLLAQVKRGLHLNSDDVIYRRARSLELTARPDMPFSIDGEVHDEHPHRFEVEPGRLRVRVPA